MILHARLTPQPGTFWQRLLPWFILNPLTDPWSTLRRAYTGANFIIALLALIAFLLPYAFQAAAWRTVNAAQTLIRDTVGELAVRYEDLEVLLGIEPCFAGACEQYFVWQLLLAGDRGWVAVALTLAVILYNVVRFYLTQTVMAYREEEERSGFTPKWADQRGAGSGPTTLRTVVRGALGGYQHLVWLHIFLRCLLLVVLVSFAANLGRVLLLTVEFPAP